MNVLSRNAHKRVRLLSLVAASLFASTSNAAPWWWPWPTTTAPTETRVQAIKDTISATQACRTLGDFYWEIGDRNSRQASGRVGLRFDANTVVNLASASKLPFAAYFIQRFGNPDAAEVEQLTMRSGYVNFVDPMCAVQPTVSRCFTAPSPLFPLNNQRTASETGLFSYNGGHFQKLAVDAGLGNMTVFSLQADMRSRLGVDTGVSVLFPGAAGGLRMSASGYGALLRKIMNDQLTIGELMGSSRTCTLPGTCPGAFYSPVKPRDWDYSLGHWVEHDAGAPDEAFSSIGLYGFYPWISADKQTYGIISMENTVNLTIALSSLDCGKNIRRAWLTGVMQN